MHRMTVQPTSDTPPVEVTEPVSTRYEYAMGYHRAIVERSGPATTDLWAVTIQSSLVSSVEGLYYDQESLAQDGAKILLKGVYDAEMLVRQQFYNAYLTAYGRESAPTTPGPNWVDPNPAPAPAPTDPAITPAP